MGSIAVPVVPAERAPIGPGAVSPTGVDVDAGQWWDSGRGIAQATRRGTTP